ncbi:MAG TPA: hypothetical protein VER14_05810 [Phototrophicaceae bacterium]|nr:hypothetical protein [Phototrophicaceae bacterium]
MHIPYYPNVRNRVNTNEISFPLDMENIDELFENTRQNMQSNINANRNSINIQSSSQGTGSFNIDGRNVEYFGKITTAEFNPNSGQIQRTYFGDWRLNIQNQKLNFTASFAMNDPSKNITPYEFRMDNVQVNSVQITNDDLRLGMILDISRQSTPDGKTTTLSKIATALSLIDNKVLVVTFVNSAFSITGTINGKE